MKIYLYLTFLIVLLGAAFYFASSNPAYLSQNGNEVVIITESSYENFDSDQRLNVANCLFEKVSLPSYQLRNDLLTWFKMNGYQEQGQRLIDKFMLSVGYPLDFSRIIGSTLRTGLSFENNLVRGSHNDFLTMNNLEFIYNSIKGMGLDVLSGFEGYAIDFKFITGGRMKPTLFFGPMYFSMIEGFSIKEYFSHGLKISELDLYHLIRQRNFNKIEKDNLASLDESIVFENAFFMHNYLTLSVYYRDLNASLYFIRNFPIFEPDNHNKVINILAKEIKDLPNWTEVYESLERFIASQDRLMPYSDAELVLLAEMESKYQLDFIEYYSKYFEGCSSSEINETLVNVMTSFDRSQFGFSKSFDFWRNFEDELLGYLDMIDHQDPGIKERMLIAFGEDKAAKTTELSEDQIALIEESSKLIYQGEYEGSLATLVAAIGDDEASKDIVLNQAILLGKEIGDIRKILRKGAKFNIGSFYASFSHEIEYMKELKQEGMDVMSFIGISDAVEYIFRHGEKEPFLFLVDDGVFTSYFTSNINFLDLALDSVFVSDENLFFLEILKAYGVIDVNSINQNKLERIKVLDRNLYDKVYNILFK